MTQESIMIDDKEFKLADLSDEDKGLIDLWITAKNKFEEHRKQAAIHEYAAMNFANMISSRVNGNGRPEVLGGAQPDHDS
jgi:hypothetical protein